MAVDGCFSRTKPLRILSIDNGGLQAVSLLLILRDVCKAISEAEGHSTWKSPCEIFDVIAGIGTGGWLAILLGRYRLSLDQCLIIYMKIAKAIDPNEGRPELAGDKKRSVAIDKETLVDSIERVVEERDLERYMTSVDQPPIQGDKARECYAFAVGPVWRKSRDEHQEYRLFRSYQTRAGPRPYAGPDPSEIEVSRAFVATAAAHFFLQECELDSTRYWDDSFPFTHNISSIALREAEFLFGSDAPICLLLNINPGIPTKSHINALHQTAKQYTTVPTWVKFRARSLFNIHHSEASNTQRNPRFRNNTWPPSSDVYTLLRSSTGSSTSSTSSEALERDLEHQKIIRKHLKACNRSEDVYVRLHAKPPASIPYLDDLKNPEQYHEMSKQFVRDNGPEIQNIAKRCIAPSVTPEAQVMVAPNTSQSPETSTDKAM